MKHSAIAMVLLLAGACTASTGTETGVGVEAVERVDPDVCLRFDEARAEAAEAAGCDVSAFDCPVAYDDQCADGAIEIMERSLDRAAEAGNCDYIADWPTNSATFTAQCTDG